MTKKTTITIDYDSGPNGSIEVASDGTLTEDANVQTMTVSGKATLLRLCRILDLFLRNNDIAEIRFKEEDE